MLCNGDLFMARGREILHFERDAKFIREATSWMNLGPMSKLSECQKKRKMKKMKKCGHHVAERMPVDCKFDQANKVLVTEAASNHFGNEPHTVTCAGAQFRVSHNTIGNMEFTEQSQLASNELRNHTHAPDPDGRCGNDVEMKHEDDEEMENVNELTSCGSVLLIRTCNEGKLSELYNRWLESEDSTLKLGKG